MNRSLAFRCGLGIQAEPGTAIIARQHQDEIILIMVSTRSQEQLATRIIDDGGACFSYDCDSLVRLYRPTPRIVAPGPKAADGLLCGGFEKLSKARVAHVGKFGGPAASVLSLTAFYGRAPDPIPSSGMFLGAPTATHDRLAAAVAQSPPSTGSVMGRVWRNGPGAIECLAVARARGPGRRA
jgi:hypothetical protein